MDKLANFHAIGLKLKYKYSDIFNIKYKDVLKPALKNNYDNHNKINEINNEFRIKIKNILKNNEKTFCFVEKIDKLIKKMDDIKLPIPNEPYSTLIHNDLWKYNLLFKYNNNHLNKAINKHNDDESNVMYMDQSNVNNNNNTLFVQSESNINMNQLNVNNLLLIDNQNRNYIDDNSIKFNQYHLNTSSSCCYLLNSDINILDNNMLYPTDVQIIDFEYVIYNSPIRDLVHFIYTSTTPQVQLNFDYFSNYYYDCLIKYLKILNCYNYKENFTYEKFKKELKNFGWTKIKHTLMTILMDTDESSDKIIEKLYYLLISFEKNGWFDVL